jgi:hypothetical protein
MHKSRIWSWWATTATAPDGTEHDGAVVGRRGADSTRGGRAGKLTVLRRGSGAAGVTFRGEVVPENGELDSLWQ